MLYEISQRLGRILFWFGFRVRIEGIEHVPRDGGYLVVANHASFLDPFVIGVYLPRHVHFLMYARYYFFPLFHWYCKRTGCIPLKKDGRDISALKQALRLLRSGGVVGIFPEGERSFTGELGPGEPGVALMALKAGVPILPVGLLGTYAALPRGAKFPRLRSRLAVRYGEPFRIEAELPDLAEKRASDDAVQQQVLTLIMHKIATVCAQPPPQTLVA